MKYRQLGSTALQVSEIGLGTVKFGRNADVKYPQPFSLPSDKALQELLSLALSLGINLLDTAPAYGSSEIRLGGLLKKQRHQWILSSKVGEEYQPNLSSFDFTASYINRRVEQSLKDLQTDYLDILLIHSDGRDKVIIEEYDVFRTVEKLKQRGLIRTFGMSTKTVEGGLLALQNADVVMSTYNPAYTDELPVLQAAEIQNKGILIKKALASGHLTSLAEKNPIHFALNFILMQKSVSSIIIGTINPSHLKECVDCL